MYYGAGYDPYQLNYYRNEYYQPNPQQMDYPYPLQQEMIHPYMVQQQEINHSLPMQQHEFNQSYPTHQLAMQQPQQPQPNQTNFSSQQQSPAQGMGEQQPGENEKTPQTPFDYFQKPEQPMNWPNNTSFDPAQFQQNQQVPPGIISQFQNQNGQLDVDKVIGTVGQLANTYHQVAPIFKQFGSLMKNFRVGG